MVHISQKPAIWVLILIAGLSQLSETIYSPSLPELATSLRITAEHAEYTFTIYLFGFALGVLFWGWCSDRSGRRPALLVGLLFYVLGCVGCYLSTDISMLMMSRFVQAFGISTGSVIGMAVCRDAFVGPERLKVFTTITAALAFAPAIGPMIGGFIAQYLPWSMAFALLAVIGALLFFIVLVQLPETAPAKVGKPTALLHILKLMIQDRRVLVFGFLVAGCNGISFSYYAEGSFYLITLLHIEPQYYGASYLFVAVGLALGSWLSRYFHHKAKGEEQVISFGLWLLFTASLTLLLAALVGVVESSAPLRSAFVTLTCIAVMSVGIGLVSTNTLATALQGFQHAMGTAGSWFGFYYYCGVSLFTYGMGALRNGSLQAMPFYFTLLTVSMLIIFKGSKGKLSRSN